MHVPSWGFYSKIDLCGDFAFKAPSRKSVGLEGLKISSTIQFSMLLLVVIITSMVSLKGGVRGVSPLRLCAT